MKMNRASHQVINSRGWPRQRRQLRSLRVARFRRWPVMETRSASARTKRLTLSPGLGYEPGLKGVPQAQRAAKSFSLGLGYEPGQLSPNKSDL
jgi:hypothetical protein